MNTCGTCKYFGPPNEWRIPEDYRRCMWIQHNQEKVPGSNYSAVLVDASGYFAALCVRDDFGCNLWAAVSPDNT